MESKTIKKRTGKSVLVEHYAKISQLRKDGETFQAISTYLSINHNIEISTGTIHAFLKLRENKKEEDENNFSKNEFKTFYNQSFKIELKKKRNKKESIDTIMEEYLNG
jgi:hypothetical protein